MRYGQTIARDLSCVGEDHTFVIPECSLLRVKTLRTEQGVTVIQPIKINHTRKSSKFQQEENSETVIRQDRCPRKLEQMG
jgi:hypothetical protein